MADIKEYIKKLQDGTVSVEEQQLAISKIEETIKIAKQKRDEAVGQKADMVVEALRQIENRLNDKYEELLRTPAMVGEQGPQGPAGKDGKDGKDGLNGRDGVDGKDGKDGVDGKDGISVVDASVDFDGSLVITLSDGNQIDAGQIFSPEVAQNIQIFRGGGGGTSLPDQSGNAGKYLTTDGTELSWATVSSGSGTVTSVDLSVPTGLTVSGNPITTSGTIAISLATGYSIPTTASQANWDAAYNDKVNSASFDTLTGVLTLTQQDGGSVTVDLDGRYLTSETDSQTLSWNGSTGELTISSGNTVDLDGRYLTSFTETDPVFTASAASGITTTDISNWNTAYSWGNHASAGYVTTSGTQTLTNKRINPRAVAAGSTSGNLTPNGDTTDVFNAFGLTGAITVLAPSGTPVDGQRLILRFEDNGSARGITWTTTSGAYRAVGITLPTTTSASKITYVGCVYNSTDVFWDVIAVATQA
jgi:hypothetical protein